MTDDAKLLEAMAEAIADKEWYKGWWDSAGSEATNRKGTYRKYAQAALTAYHSHASVKREEAGMVEVPKNEYQQLLFEVAVERCRAEPTSDQSADCVHRDCRDYCAGYLLLKLNEPLQAAQGGKGGS
jgi:hypothetical protein